LVKLFIGFDVLDGEPSLKVTLHFQA